MTSPLIPEISTNNRKGVCVLTEGIFLLAAISISGDTESSFGADVETNVVGVVLVDAELARCV